MKSCIKEVAYLAGVSEATVSYVLNGTKKVRAETEKRVRDAAQKLHYQVNPLGRNLRKGESKLVGFVVSDLSNYFFHDIYLGLEKRLARYGYRTIIVDSEEDKNTEMENVQNLLARSVDALIIAPTSEDCSYLKLMLEHNFIPVVFVDRKPIGFESDMVLSANEEGGYEATKHLISRGYREIAFIGSRFDSTMEERLDGYRKALHEEGIPVNSNYIRFGQSLPSSQPDLQYGAIYEHTLDLITNYKVTAIFSGNNLATVGAFSCLKKMGIKVPNEVAFITFDDSFWLSLTTPALSAIAQNPDLIGDSAGRMIYQRLINLRADVSRIDELARIPTRLIVRDSS